jgi:hypothetical protein
MAVPVGSEFLAYNNFPEVYHGEGISKAAIFASARRIAGPGKDTIYSTNVSWHGGTCCVSWPLRAGGKEEDPEQPEIGSARRESGQGYDN